MIFAKEMRSGALLAPLFVLVEALREAAKRGSFRGLGLTTRVPVPADTEDGRSRTGRKDQVRTINQVCSSVGMPLATGRGQLTGSAKGQCSHLAH
ncbi:hypothetical protein GCM10010371_11390 [Streptomyces subrutilus]|uniref:Uncharacterized protein n=1 Tax=Streptomyces subrutilus TaxID=36818 RepID=A0A918V0Y8_9ACTN|nr:hypothetical protein GCM10010371_11390 [Streptomyces subrutilus]